MRILPISACFCSSVNAEKASYPGLLLLFVVSVAIVSIVVRIVILSSSLLLKKRLRNAPSDIDAVVMSVNMVIEGLKVPSLIPSLQTRIVFQKSVEWSDICTGVMCNFA